MKNLILAISSIILIGCGGGNGGGSSADWTSQEIKKVYFTPTSATGYYDVYDINGTVVDSQAFSINTTIDGNNSLYTYVKSVGNESIFTVEFTDSGETFINDINITSFALDSCPFYDDSSHIVTDLCKSINDSNSTHTYVVNGHKNIGINEIHTVEDVNKTYTDRTIFHYN